MTKTECTIYEVQVGESDCETCGHNVDELIVTVTHDPRSFDVYFSLGCHGVRGYEGPDLEGALRELDLIGAYAAWDAAPDLRGALDDVVADLKKEFGNGPTSPGSEPAV